MGQQHKVSALYPIGRFSIAKEWPNGVLIVPGNHVWLLFESGAAHEDATPAMVHFNNQSNYRPIFRPMDFDAQLMEFPLTLL